MTTLYIKNMVCERCKAAVKGALATSQIQYKSVELGEVELEDPPSEQSLEHLRGLLGPLGFELIENKTARQVNQIKKLILDWVRGEAPKSGNMKFSVFLSDRMHKDYPSLSNLFSSIEGTTLEQYLIHQKIERAKELLVYNELSLGEIADRLNYSSVQHLSNQFKKITGLTPTHFKSIGARKRLPLDKV